MSISSWGFPTNIQFGAGALSELVPALKGGIGSKPLIVTDPGMVGLPPYESVLQELQRQGVPFAVFSGISPNPEAPDVEAGLASYNEAGCDCIIGLGGGSAMDGAKAIQLMTTHDGKIQDYDERVGGYERIANAVPPCITIPTTAGTGSEVGRSTVIVDPATHEKMVIFHPYLMPVLAIVDPQLMTTMPATITAATGMDALTHNVEAYLSKGFHPLCDGIALEGVRLCRRSLEKAVHSPEDLDARADMAAAALMGAVAFQKGLGVTHSLAHPLSTLAGLHHGLANGILLPYAMAFNAKGVPERFVGLAEAAGVSIPGGSAADQANAFIAWIKQMKVNVGIPARLHEAGVDGELIPAMTDQALADGCHACNPIVVTRDDLENLYQEAL